jgi:hypothetical protein
MATGVSGTNRSNVELVRCLLRVLMGNPGVYGGTATSWDYQLGLLCAYLVLRVPRQHASTQTGLVGQAEMADGVDLRCSPDCRASVGHRRSTRVTRGELRPVHITLIATCRVDIVDISRE